MINPETLTKDLAQFYRSESRRPWSILFRRCVMTDGVKYLADNAGEHGAYWLLDIIASYQPRLRKDPFQVWVLKVNRNKKPMAVVTCEDGNGKRLVRQKIEYTDFQLDEIKLYAEHDGVYLTIMLPDER